jgi:hypothetical protein
MYWQERCCVGELRYFLLQSDAKQCYENRSLDAFARLLRDRGRARRSEVLSVVRYLALNASGRKPLVALRRSLTGDRGTELANHVSHHCYQSESGCL